MINYDKHDVKRFLSFLKKLENDIYPEPESIGPNNIILNVLEGLVNHGYLTPGMRVLDVGCGQGYAMMLMTKLGLKPIGVTVGTDDLDACRRKGLHVQCMDQSFLKFQESIFDFIWCRHCIEHSVFPYFTLSGFHRVMKPGAGLYLEMPAPDTCCEHHTNKNHYSILGKEMWSELILRSKFEILNSTVMKIETLRGPDQYYSFVAKKHDL